MEQAQRGWEEQQKASNGTKAPAGEFPFHHPASADDVYLGGLQKTMEFQPDSRRHNPLCYVLSITCVREEHQQLVVRALAFVADVEEYDARTEARKLIEQLSQADVVITTFPVLQREHHYPPLEERMRVLRRPKRYIVPESPLISMRSAYR